MTGWRLSSSACSVQMSSKVKDVVSGVVSIACICIVTSVHGVATTLFNETGLSGVSTWSDVMSDACQLCNSLVSASLTLESLARITDVDNMTCHEMSSARVAIEVPKVGQIRQLESQRYWLWLWLCQSLRVQLGAEVAHVPISITGGQPTKLLIG